MIFLMTESSDGKNWGYSWVTHFQVIWRWLKQRRHAIFISGDPPLDTIIGSQKHWEKTLLKMLALFPSLQLGCLLPLSPWRTSASHLCWDGPAIWKPGIWLPVLDAEAFGMGPSLHLGDPAGYLSSSVSFPGIPEEDVWSLGRDGKQWIKRRKWSSGVRDSTRLGQQSAARVRVSWC